MSELRKIILISIIISLFVGISSGLAGGIVAMQIASGNIGQSLIAKLPLSLQWIVPSNAPQTPSPDLRPPSPTGRGEGEGIAPVPVVPDERISTVDVVRRVSPAVVSILISKEVSVRSSTPFSSDFFREFGFEVEQPEAPAATTQKRQVGGGTGFIISADGLIITNKHVIFDDTATYAVVTSDGKEYPAKIVARDPFIDVGFLKIEAKGLSTVRLGDSDALEIGETVIAIGNALSEFSNTITVGVISGIKRRVTAAGVGVGSEVIEEAIQTDAAINPGNSGGPLVNLKGEVIGINTAVSQAGQLIGFATPINQAKLLIASVKKDGRIIRPWLGVRYILITAELKKENNLPVDYGAIIARGERPVELAVSPGSPADKAGLRENDILLEIDKIKITESSPLAPVIQKHKVGDSVTLKVLSQGKEREVKIVLEELK
ncbi:MAG: trypsin-like peptidase domain-containing protein [bacterium]|nr:trypsin-like peptidase domain-containing protein [bacterium]